MTTLKDFLFISFYYLLITSLYETFFFLENEHFVLRLVSFFITIRIL